MCGIAGLIDDDLPAHSGIDVMLELMRHRGPDGQGIHHHGLVTLGHARLSIIDLEGGRQPLFNEQNTVVAVCNGEIYNYRELRESLTKSGHRFRTHSDCEVLVHLWEDFGPKMLHELRGMFAFAIHDTRTGELFCARDRFGQKPFYFSVAGSRFAFASCVKSLLSLPWVSRELSPFATDRYLARQFVPAPQTLLKDVWKLPAGCQLHWKVQPTQESERLVIQQYWQPSFCPDEAKSHFHHLESLNAALEDAVTSHMVADVPVGVFLSGGIDSSLIAAMAKRHVTRLPSFAISFPGSEHDEGPFARQVASLLGTEHHEIPFEPGSLIETLEQAQQCCDQPLADTALLPLLTLSRFAAQHVKVVLTGDGGDELFGGYRFLQRLASYPANSRWVEQGVRRLLCSESLARCHHDRWQSRKMRARLGAALSGVFRTEYERRAWEGWERFQLYSASFHQQLHIATSESPGQADRLAMRPDSRWPTWCQALYRLQGSVLADRLLHKADLGTMAFGLEARAPLLDHRLAAIAASLPARLIISSNRTKIALREIAARWLPAEVTNRRKKGFSMPLDRWLRTSLYDWARSRLTDPSSICCQLFERSVIEDVLADHHSGKDHSARIYTLLVLEIWYQSAVTNFAGIHSRAA